MIRRGVSGWMFLLVPAYPGSPGQRAVKQSCVCVCRSTCEPVKNWKILPEQSFTSSIPSLVHLYKAKDGRVIDSVTDSVSMT